MPYYLQHCLKYCRAFLENYWIPKGRLIRLLVADGLLQKKAGILGEDIAEENTNRDQPGNAPSKETISIETKQLL